MAEYVTLWVDDLPDLKRGERIVRCRDCKHSHKDGTLCNFFASWVPIAGGDEYECMPVEVEPDGFCKWGEPKEDK
jgi:hypothetical protein